MDPRVELLWGAALSGGSYPHVVLIVSCGIFGLDLLGWNISDGTESERIPGEAIDAVKIVRIVFWIVRCVDGTGAFGDASKAGRTAGVGNAGWSDAVKVTTAVVDQFVSNPESAPAFGRIRVEK